MKKFIAGPWVGEFGWELFAWQGYVRALSRKFDKTLIISRSNSKALYDDFADEFIPYEPVGGSPDSFFMHNTKVKDCFMEVAYKHNISLNKDTTLLLPRRIGFPPHTHYKQHVVFGTDAIRPEYIQYGASTDTKYDYVFHIRSRELRQEDNWTINNWKTFKKLLNSDKIACIGTKKESGCLEDTDDLRDIDLGSVFSVLSGAKCCFGPSSGPMHLASLCDCPHVVWSIEDNKIRYEQNWNPLKTRVLFDSKYGWHPSPEYLYERFANWFNRENNK